MKEARRGIREEVTLIHVCDREGDMYELFDMAEKEKELFLVRIVQNRTTVDDKKIMTSLEQEPIQGRMVVQIARNTKENIPARKVLMNYTYQQYEIKCPKRRKEEHLSKSLEVTGIYVREAGVPKEKAIEWFLMTNMEVTNIDEVVTLIGYYVQRWKIERFHFILKSGCKIEDKQASSYEKLCTLTLLYSLIALKILHLTYIGRIAPNLPCNLLFEDDEWKVLYCIANKTKEPPSKPYTLQEAVKYIGILAGFKGAPSDGPPGVKLIWIGLQKLMFALSCREYLIFCGSS